MIKQAEEHDILVIEEILLDAVMWMEKNKLQNQWNENSIKWNSLSKELINFAKNLSLKNGINSLRLDCNLQRNKLRMLYENEGFIYAGKKKSKNNYDMAIYVWHI